MMRRLKRRLTHQLAQVLPRRAEERIAVTSIAASLSRVGRMLGRRSASMVLPEPGGPVSSIW